MNIYLTGFMGTGKSEVGRLLAAAKRWTFVDLDERIEEEEGASIPEIFRDKGEAYFRTRERSALAAVAAATDTVVSCGGGIVIDPANRRLMKDTGSVICLSARAEVILERTRTFCHRPLLNVPDPRAKIEALLKERQPFYAQADSTIDTSDLSPAQVCGTILEFLSRRP
jgi:shikimate kinase